MSAMTAKPFLFRVLLSLILNLPMVGDKLVKAESMQESAEMLSQEMNDLLQELEQRQGFSWGAPLFATLQQWPFWVTAGVLVLLSGFWWWFRKRNHEPDTRDKESSGRNMEQVEEKEEKHHGTNDLERISEDYIEWPVQDMARERKEVEDLVLTLLHNIRQLPSNTVFPVLLPPIGVGSVFEGWSPCKDDSYYRFLVPLKPPHGHTFDLELSTAGEVPERSFRIHVGLVCTCTMEQQVEKIQCFLHQSEEELRKNQALSLLHTLCTGSYLDVQKTVCWFNQNVESVWKTCPELFQCFETVLPSSRSCKFHVRKGSEKILTIELIFGVQHGDSDIFLSSQTAEITFTPITMWSECYAVAEVKFFRHMAREAPYDTFHLSCLQVCAHILVNTSFSMYIFKTVVMHVLTITQLSGQCRRDCLLLLLDVMQYLCCCLAEKRLNHFFFGNENVPKELILPPDFQTAEPLNLFQPLIQDPHVHAKAQREFLVLRDRLRSVLIYGH